MITAWTRPVVLYMRALSLLSALCVIHAVSAQAATRHVPTASYLTIQSAIDAAAPGDLVLVAPGTYFETITFLGKGITVRSSGGPLVTIIDGTGSNGSVVQCVSGEGPDTVIEGFTITGGSADVGGGMRNIGSSPTVIDCIFKDNNATDRGGGMYNRQGSPTIIGSMFKMNSAVEMGGGMFNLRASPTVTNSVFCSEQRQQGRRHAQLPK